MAKGEPKARQLFKQMGRCLLAYNYYTTATTIDGVGWEVILGQDALANPIPYLTNRTYIDISGYSREELTTFIRGVDFQHQKRPRSSTEGILEITVLDILSTRRLTDAEIINWQSDAGTSLLLGAQDAPGFLDSTVDLQHVVYGERTTYVINSTMAVGLAGSVYVTLGGDTFGSGQPIATDKLHWTRTIWLNGSGDNEIVFIGATNLAIQAITAEEKDLVWMERLRRSYVVQDQGDI